MGKCQCQWKVLLLVFFNIKGRFEQNYEWEKRGTNIETKDHNKNTLEFNQRIIMYLFARKHANCLSIYFSVCPVPGTEQWKANGKEYNM
jgi:hypothetical protein